MLPNASSQHSYIYHSIAKLHCKLAFDSNQASKSIWEVILLARININSIIMHYIKLLYRNITNTSIKIVNYISLLTI